MTDSGSSRSDPGPIFIVGPPFSGTTLLKQILNRHPEIFLLNDTHFMDMVYPLRGRLDPGNDTDREELIDRILKQIRTHLEHDRDGLPFERSQLRAALSDTPPETYRDLFRTVLDLARSEHDATISGDETPRHLFHLGTLLDWFPGAQVFVPVRDGRDVFAAYKHFSRRKNVSEEKRERIASQYHPVTTSILWRSMAKTCLAWEDHPRVHRVRFERLLSETDVLIRDLLDTVDLKYDPDMLQPDDSSRVYSGDHSGAIIPYPQRRWESRLTLGERFWFRLINQDVMYDLGYVMNGRGGMLEAMQYVFSFPFHLTYALWKNRNRTASAWSYLLKRLNPGR